MQFKIIINKSLLGRILAIDYGQKRVGIAVTDPLKIIANGLTTVHSKDIFQFLTDYFQSEAVECVVIGYPKTLKNEGSESLKYINPFIKKFQKTFPDMKIEQMDERFTSKMAFQTMIDAGVKKHKRRDKALVDTISAALILQTYMSYIENTKI